ncbi:hypothetical protein GH733_002626 [Mirounga leonina]|nr:hypothetical protein GH733_002626 [Mirounga leonina]
MEPSASPEPDSGEVLPQHKFDSGSLEAYLNQHLPGFGAEPEAKLTVTQYSDALCSWELPPVVPCVSFWVFPGRIFRDFTIPGVTPAECSAMYVAMIETLARLHSLNVQSLQLEGYGRGAGYCKRQSRVIAILDWELSTIGHPLSDLAHLSVFYFWPRTVPGINQNFYFQENIGIPSIEELISIYCRCRGINSILPNWNFFLALACFKMAGIAQLFVLSKTGQEVLARVKRFMKQHILPAEKEVIEFYVQNENSVDRWKKPLVIDKLKEMAKAEGLWNLFLPAVSGLSQVDYALIAEETGKCFFAPDVFNCQAPDTGNMELLHLYGSEKQKQQWLEPLLQGNIASCFCMTEPNVASSDATNIECSIQRDGDSYVINGKKWWSSGPIFLSNFHNVVFKRGSHENIQDWVEAAVKECNALRDLDGNIHAFAHVAVGDQGVDDVYDLAEPDNVIRQLSDNENYNHCEQNFEGSRFFNVGHPDECPCCDKVAHSHNKKGYYKSDADFQHLN